MNQAYKESQMIKVLIDYETGLFDYRRYAGVILNPSTEEVTYELPLVNLRSGEEFPLIDVQINLKAFEIVNQDTDAKKFDFTIRDVKLVWNPEYEKIKEFYKIPVFFRSLADNGSHIAQGFVDNGKEKVSLDKTKRRKVNYQDEQFYQKMLVAEKAKPMASRIGDIIK